MMQSEINVTPLVDVCLVLLIIFMVAMPLMVTGTAVQLPETKHGSAMGKEPIGVTVMYDGTVVVGSVVVRADQVAAEMQRLRKSLGEGPINVRGDKRVLYGEVMTVLDACRAAGWEDVRLVSLRAGDADEPRS